MKTRSRLSGHFGGLWLTGLSLICASFLAYGQETTGSISGTVTDPSGAGIPGAKVEVSGGNLPKAVTATTDTSGGYRLPNLSPSSGYVVSVTANGFRLSKKTEVGVVLGRSSRLDFKLEVGAVTESVVVSADSVILDTSSSSSEINVDRSFFDLMPKGRSFDGLVNLAPGARGESKSGGYQVDGASGSENTFYLGGMEVTSIQTGTLPGGSAIPVEMIQQVQVKNGIMDAQYGGSMGGVISASIRSGSNAYHGEAGFFHTNSGLFARPRPTLQLDPNNDDKSMYLQNVQDTFRQWSPLFSIGGPIPFLKDKLFFYSSYSPITTDTDRTVAFVNGVTKPFASTATQRYLANKVDYLPSNKLRTNYTWVWSPGFTRGLLPNRNGQDDPTSNWGGFGSYTSNNLIAGQIDYIFSAKTIASFRGGYNYSNTTNLYSIPLVTGIYYSNSNVNIATPGLPDAFKRPTGWLQQPQAAQLYNLYPRVNLNADLTHMVNWHGQHSFRGGWSMNRLGNAINSTSYPNGYYRYYWNPLAYNCVTSQCTGRNAGAYGYYRYREFGTTGDVRSNNQAMFLQDNWRVNKKLTLNLGLRTESEFVPSFATGNNTPSKAIKFDWTQKMSPRLGVAYDLNGDGKNRIYAGFGFFYDTMKYELPRGSFGGDKWKDYYFTMDDPTLPTKLSGIPANPKSLPGKFLEVIDYRIPSNDPSDNLIDPNLKPMKTRLFDIGYDRQLSSTLLASFRYTNRRLVRTIEDVGALLGGGETYYIANPGYGLTVDPKTWDPGIPVTPKAKRNYDAFEARLDRRFTSKYQFTASYTWSRLYGNYSGLASSDENGRTSPNVNRYFDLPWISYNNKGQIAEGRLATDRPHTLKFFGQYSHQSKLGLTTLAPNFVVYSGTPITSEVNVLGVPMYYFGRGDLGRTPIFSNTDFNVVHQFAPFKSKEQVKMFFEFSVFNLFNSSTVTNIASSYVHQNDGSINFNASKYADIFKGFDLASIMKTQELRKDPTYGMASGFQSPRSARLRFTIRF